MPILKRFYALFIILLLITISYLLIIADRGSISPIIITKQQPQKNIKKFITRLFPNTETSDLHMVNIQIPPKNNHLKNVLEIQEVNLHQVSLIYEEQGKLKAVNWFKCKPNSLISLSTTPFFTLNQSKLKSNLTIVYNGTSLSAIPIKLYSNDDFYMRKANRDLVKTIVILLLVLALIASICIYFMIESFYSLSFSIYLFFCLISNLVYNGFANNFWPFNIPYLSDHFLGLSLSVHILLMSCFLVYLIKKNKITSPYYYLAHLPLVAGIIVLLLSTVFESYVLFNYLMVLALILSLSFVICYPIIFSEYKKKYAYWLNYLGIFSITFLFLLSTAKSFNFIEGTTIFDISNRILFLGHILSLSFAFVLITKTRLVHKFNYLFEKEIKYQESQNSESFSAILAILSEREYIVLELISLGFKDQEIADKLCVSVTTIKTHNQRIYKKLNINNRSQATQIFLKFTSKTMDFVIK
jgi:NarL family two-component system response regulator LiaR